MTFIEAIKTCKPLTRRNKSWTYTYTGVYYMEMNRTEHTIPGTFIEPTFFLEHIRLTRQDILARDWIVKR